MKKGIAHYLIFFFKQIIFIVYILVSLFTFLHIIFGKMESWEATGHAIFFTTLGYIFIPIYNKLIKINQKSTNKVKKLLLVIIAFAFTLFMLFYNLISLLGTCNCIGY